MIDEPTADGSADGPHGSHETPAAQNGTWGLIDTVGSGTSTTEEPRIMSDDEKFIARFRDLIADVRSDERRKTLDALMQGIQTGVPRQDDEAVKRVTRHPDAEKATRAPAGSGRVLCKRALTEAGNGGLTAKDVHDRRQGEYESKLTLSAVRNELMTGEKASPPLYKHVGGVWYLTEFAPPAMRIVS